MKVIKYVPSMKRNEIELKGDSNGGKNGRDKFSIIIKNTYACLYMYILYVLKNQTHDKLTEVSLLLFTGDQNQLCSSGYERYVGMPCLSSAI